jgi:alkylation response protein AidB-like acyl-CoA dehydrogenase
MDFQPSIAQRELAEKIATFARHELDAGAAERDRSGIFSKELWLECGKHRLQGLVVPLEYGGGGLDAPSAVIALEALGYGSGDAGLNFSICAHLLACVVPIWKHGSEKQKQELLPRLSDGTLVAANAMTEPGSGSDAFALITRAEPDGNCFRLNGTKVFASNGPHADVILTYAATDTAKGYHGGITAFIVPKNAPGVRTGPPFKKLGLRTSHMSEVIFENAVVGADAVLGGIGGGAGIFAQSMDWERICLGAIHVGAMHRLLDLCVKHARTTKVAGEAIGKSQGVSHVIANMKVRFEASRLMLYRAASLLDNAKNVSMEGAIAKLFISESLVEVAQGASTLFGHIGITEGHEAERALRDSLAARIYSGTSEIQRNIIARWLGL